MSATPSTFFTAPPHWEWLVILYFFVGGLAGGCYFLAAQMDLFGAPRDRDLARLGYYVALPAVVLSAVLLTFDLGRPFRFWHMLLQSNRMVPIFKPWSPMSVGAWALLFFGAFALFSALAALAEGGTVKWRRLSALRPPGLLGTVIVAVGGLLGFFVAGYTGVLLTVTNRPIWSDTPLLGLAFLVSAASSSAALLLLLAAGRAAAGSLGRLSRFDHWVLILEFFVLCALLASLGRTLRLWLGAWGLLFVLGLIVGIVVPVALQWRPLRLGRLATPTAAVLVLVGALILCIVIVLSAQAV